MRYFGLVLICSIFSVAAASPASVDSLKVRIERIKGMLNKISGELRALESALEEDVFQATPSRGASPDSQPLFSLLLTPRQKKLYRALAGQLHRVGVGTGVADTEGPIANFILWRQSWGFKAEVGAILEESEPQYIAMGGVYLLRSLHAFSLMEIPDLFHFYVLGGARVMRKSADYEVNKPGPSVYPNPTGKDKIYEKPDINADIIIGVGTEVFLPLISGVRLTPELGYKASYFFSRYQDSDEWPALGDYETAKPENDFSLGWHFAFNLYFYFK